MRFKNPGGQICCWLEALSDYDFIIQHRRGDRHSNADGLSRIPERQTCDCYVAGQELDTLPCGGCSYCTRAHKQWQRFEEDVDDVVPLSLKQLPSGSREAAEVRTVEVERNTAESTEGRSAPGTSESGSSSQLHQTQVDDSRDDRPSTTRGESNFMAQVTQQELRDFQLKDSDIRPVLSWLKAGGVPKEAELQMQSVSTIHYWVHRAQLQMKGGVLYYLWNTQTQTIFCWWYLRNSRPLYWNKYMIPSQQDIWAMTRPCRSCVCDATGTEWLRMSDYMWPLVPHATRARSSIGNHGHPWRSIKQAYPETGCIWTCLVLFVSQSQEIGMSSWSWISSQGGWSWCLYQRKMQNKLLEPSLKTIWSGLEYHWQCTLTRGGISKAIFLQLSVTFWRQQKHGQLLIVPVQMVKWSDIISWCSIIWGATWVESNVSGTSTSQH